MIVDLQLESRARFSAIDAFLLLLGATNSIQFREEEWKWAPTAENAKLVQQHAAKDLQRAMFQIKAERNGHR